MLMGSFCMSISVFDMTRCLASGMLQSFRIDTHRTRHGHVVAFRNAWGAARAGHQG